MIPQDAADRAAVAAPTFGADVFGITLVGNIEFLVDYSVAKYDTNHSTMARYKINI